MVSNFEAISDYRGAVLFDYYENPDNSQILSYHFFTAANGIYQNTVFGLAAKLPFNYIGAVVLGSVSLRRFTNVIYIVIL